METYQVLEKALALIEDEKNWGQGNLNPAPKVFCAEGACRAVMDLDPFEETESYRAARNLLAYELERGGHPCPLWRFNDSHTHAEVIALFQKAIQNEKQRAGVYVELPEEIARV